jgi:hypothetical protein
MDIQERNAMVMARLPPDRFDFASVNPTILNADIEAIDMRANSTDKNYIHEEDLIRKSFSMNDFEKDATASLMLITPRFRNQTNPEIFCDATNASVNTRNTAYRVLIFGNHQVYHMELY